MISGLVLVVISATQSPAPAVTVWCSTRTPMASPAVAAEVAYDRAERNLCVGNFALARSQFASIVPFARKHYQNNGRWWIDIARGYFYSLVASGQDADARAFLTGLETDQKWKPHTSDRLFWSNSPKAAFAAYASEAKTLFFDDSSVRDKNIRKAAQAMSIGDVNGAITALKQPHDECGPCTVNSLQLLMLGNAYAVQRRWPLAFATWVRAADSGHTVPEFDTLDEWNLSALEMTYYYRAHRPRS